MAARTAVGDFRGDGSEESPGAACGIVLDVPAPDGHVPHGAGLGEVSGRSIRPDSRCAQPLRGSNFVTSARQQPTATIQALAYRSADNMIRAAKAGELL